MESVSARKGLKLGNYDDLYGWSHFRDLNELAS
jgi:hypothetical protein